MKTKYEQIVNVKNIGKHSSVDMNKIFELVTKERK